MKWFKVNSSYIYDIHTAWIFIIFLALAENEIVIQIAINNYTPNSSVHASEVWAFFKTF